MNKTLVLLALFSRTACAGGLPPGWLVFQEKSGGQLDVCASDDGGLTARNLTAHPADDTAPSLSPDGSLVAFQSSRAGRSHIFVVPRLGGPATPITSGATLEQSPRWSPDGTRIYFESHRAGRWRICHALAGGQGPVTVLDSGDVDCVSPAPMPDGKRVVCELRPHGTERWRIGMLAGDGKLLWESGVPEADFNETPSVSPDGRWVYFAASSGTGYAFWRIASDGRGAPEPLPKWSGWKLHPTCAGKGRLLLFDEKTPDGWRLGALDLATGEHSTLPSVAERFAPGWRDATK